MEILAFAIARVEASPRGDKSTLPATMMGVADRSQLLSDLLHIKPF
jgi:hypothetical protein